MKMSLRALIIGAVATALVAPRAFAQDAPASTAGSRTEATKPAAKAAVKADAKSEPVTAGPGVAKQNNVNVRGQASIKSEVIAHFQKNDPITILEEITLKKPKQDEPARWYRISLPTNVAVWVHSSFIDSATKTVKPARLNLRGGPGENYSILGRLEKGAVVNELDSKNDWLKIQPPTNSFGFVAAHLVERTTAPAIVSTPPVTEQPAVITNPPPLITEVPAATPPVVPPTTPVTPPPAEAPPVTTTPPVTVPPVEIPEVSIEKVKKVVSREGILKGSVSIQAPTHFELRSLDTGKTVNYVFSPSPDLLLKQFKGKRIVVTGEELLDERWQHTPVIIVDSLEIVR
jgi:uncharacterized protein YgiM (DUF1202 family)